MMNPLAAPLYEFQLPKEILPTIITDILQIPSGPSNGSTNIIKHSVDVDLNYSYFNPELFTFLDEYLRKIAEEQYLPEAKLSITECWGTVSHKFQKHHRHTHPNSILSGIVYLTDSDAATEFYLDNPFNWAHDVIHTAKDGFSKVQVKVTPSAGKVIIFPSNLEHGTAANLSNDKRITLSFNTFFTGNMGRRTSTLSIRDVREAYHRG